MNNALRNCLMRLKKDSLKQLQGIFYDGQIHDAYHFVNELIRSAKSSITIIDNYIDDSVFNYAV